VLATENSACCYPERPGRSQRYTRLGQDLGQAAQAPVGGDPPARPARPARPASPADGRAAGAARPRRPVNSLPGFVSANIHASLDGTKVVNYAQWESQEAFTSMFSDPAAAEWLGKLAEIGTPAPVLCRVVSVHHATR
jgi:hypothetical protein